MGLKVTEDKKVSFQEGHEKRVNTSVDDNPTQKNIAGIPVRFLLRRNKTGDQDRDGNPLIYALKNIKGYSISDFHRNALIYRAAEISMKVSKDFDADYILPLPSNSDVCQNFSRILSCVTGVPIVSNEFLTKTTIGQALAAAEIADTSRLSPGQRKEWNRVLATWAKHEPSDEVSLKNINLKLRKLISPFGINELPDSLIGMKVCIFDDLMASGRSVQCAADILLNAGCSSVEAICLLSDI